VTTGDRETTDGEAALAPTEPLVPESQPFGVAELHAGGTRLAIIPALGGKIAAMEIGGRQWLWTSDTIPYAEPVDGASYVETADTGGYDECFPTVGACVVPSGVDKYGGLSLPDHGELWAQRPTIDVETLADAQQATCIWTGRRMPYRFTRVVRVDGAGVVTMHYSVTNDGAARLPFLWSSHPLLPLTPETRIELPDGARVRVYAEHGLDLGGTLAEHRWPRLTVTRKEKKRIADFSHPDAVARNYACKLFLDMPVGRAAVVEGSARLEVEYDAREVPNFGLWLNRRGWTPFKGGLFKRAKPYLNFAFEPCIGTPDPLTDALVGWQDAHWLEGGETRSWTLTWRGKVSV
jgi:galactose mutarotase-like enzyme